MVGADPKSWTLVARAAVWRVAALARDRPPRLCCCRCLALLVQCGKAPPAATLAANAHAASSDSFEDRFPAPQFRDRFPSESESIKWPSREAQRQRTVRTEKITPDASARPSSYRVASYAPTLPLEKPREDLTTLVSMKSSAFPYFGENPRSEAPFLNVSKGERRGHRSYSGKVYWQDETYNDSRVLVHVPEHFDAKKPGVIVVFFHGNGATLERDVRDRQMVPQQISEFRRQRRAACAPTGRRCRRFQRRQILAAERLQALHGRVGIPPRPSLWRSEFGKGLCQHADRDRRL